MSDQSSSTRSSSSSVRSNKRLCESSDSREQPTKRRILYSKSVDKWIVENDKELQTSVWLKYDVLNREQVECLKCSVCTQFQSRLVGMRNYSSAFINGSKNLRASNFKDHASSSMHKKAMDLLRRQQGTDIVEYSPIARALAGIDEAHSETLRKKFEIAYYIAKEKLAFSKMRSVCELEEKHGVQLGDGYKSDHACATFVKYIAQDLQDSLINCVKNVHFVGLQADGSTDTATVEQELYTIQYLDSKTDDGIIHIRNRFLCVRKLACGNASGLYDCLESAMDYVQLSDWKTKLVAFGTDGAAVNIAGRGLKGLCEKEVPWVVFFWCMAHRLELAMKDSLKSTFFATIDELLMRLYYIYEKSPKKCSQLEGVYQELKMCLTETDQPLSKGKRPLRACGTRFISHKVAALGRIIDKYGVYCAHLKAMSEDTSYKQADRVKLRAYAKQWGDSKVLLGCAYFYDILKPCSMLCKALQDDEVCVVRAVEVLLKAKKELDQKKALNFDELVTVKKVIDRIETVDNEKTYQKSEIKNYDASMSFFNAHYKQYMESMQVCLRDRIKVQHEKLLDDTLTILATNGWGKADNASFGHLSLSNICAHFQIPLEAAGVDLLLVEDEWNDVVDYARRYLDIVRQGYKNIWWKIFNSPDARKWANVLRVVELLFTLPVSNGRVERLFSQLKLVKTSNRSCLNEDTLDQLVRITIEGPPLSQWNASGAISLWLADKRRRLNQSTSSTQQVTQANSHFESHSESQTLLDDWQTWMNVD